MDPMVVNTHELRDSLDQSKRITEYLEENNRLKGKIEEQERTLENMKESNLALNREV